MKLPTYVRYNGVTPDLRGSNDTGILDGFFHYPANPVRAIQGVPGDGSAISMMTNIPTAIPPGVGKNEFWQAVNKRIGSELKITMSSNDDYPTKFATVVAGGDLPDVINIPPGAIDQPALLKAKCHELTDQLTGDNVKKYPFLANLPTEAWKGCVYNGGIYAIPVPRGSARTALPIYRADLVKAKGIKDPQPKTFDDFLKLCTELTDAKHNRWAWGSAPLAYVQQMYGLPNQWKQENGKFTNVCEIAEAKDALSATKRLVDAGVTNPDGFTAGSVEQKQWFNSGTILFVLDSYVAWTQFYRDNTNGDSFDVDMLDVTGYDSGRGTPWMGLAYNNITAFNKSSKHSVKTLLNVANWMAAPFGTEEYLFRKYGTKGADYTLTKSDPEYTKKGVSETGIGLQYICDAPMALYLGGHPEVAQKQFKSQTAVIPRAINDASYGLYSQTQSRKQTQINGVLTDLTGQILRGEKPVSAWDDAVSTWRSTGGDQMRGELEKAFGQQHN
ncbi:MAG TPA: extracellular solute-binding protein [Mycobacteriales bacterium]|nr:extracellular solute-binding protein [Mycobacteriales bacterium]